MCKFKVGDIITPVQEIKGLKIGNKYTVINRFEQDNEWFIKTKETGFRDFFDWRFKFYKKSNINLK